MGPNSFTRTAVNMLPGGGLLTSGYDLFSGVLGIGGKSKCAGPYNYDRATGTCVPKSRAVALAAPPPIPGGGMSTVPGITTGLIAPPARDATPYGSTPAEVGMGEGGIISPYSECVPTLRCPKFADGKTGILWLHALSGEIVCLPRGVNGRGFGLIRKNKPRAKPYISAAEKRLLTKTNSLAKKAKDFASLSGMRCTKK